MEGTHLGDCLYLFYGIFCENSWSVGETCNYIRTICCHVCNVSIACLAGVNSLHDPCIALAMFVGKHNNAFLIFFSLIELVVEFVNNFCKSRLELDEKALTALFQEIWQCSSSCGCWQ